MTHPTDDSLKPCPFCGSQPEPAPYVLKCVNAYCEAQPSVSGGNDDECATAWNKRALLVEQARTEPHKAEDAPSDAAAVDVAGLMAIVQTVAFKSWDAGLCAGSWNRVGEDAADAEVQAAKVALESALRLALAAREGWQPIETAPKDGRSMLLGYPNGAGKWRTVRGQWFSDAEIAETWEEDGDEGWYETSVECEDLPNCWAIEPTHWMPLPAAAPKGTT